MTAIPPEPDAKTPRRDSPLDRPVARVIAGGVLAAVAVALLAIHWGDLFPPPAPAVDANDPAAACIAQRSQEIERMVAENPQMAGQKAMFLERAAAMCRATSGGPPPGTPPGPPPLPRQ